MYICVSGTKSFKKFVLWTGLKYYSERRSWDEIMNPLVFVVDDEPDILELVSLHLEKASFKTKGFLSASELFGSIEKNQPDLIILDLMLPDMDGLEVCKSIKKNQKLASVPIIILTAKGEEADKIVGLELGADDYVTKPFSPKELVARVKAVLRRFAESRDSESQIKIGHFLTIDPNRHQALVENKLVELTSTEFKILEKLSSKPGWVFSREKLLDYLWGDEKAVLDRTIDVHIRHLRKKLGRASHLIKNVRGVGYKLEG